MRVAHMAGFRARCSVWGSIICCCSSCQCFVHTQFLQRACPDTAELPDQPAKHSQRSWSHPSRPFAAGAGAAAVGWTLCGAVAGALRTRSRTPAVAASGLDAATRTPLGVFLARRSATFLAPALVALIGPASASGDGPAPALDTAAPASDVGSVFVGRYTDPNHPGGYREISLLDSWRGDLRLAKVEGGGGRGEPPFFTLKAIVGKRADRRGGLVDVITIDFSPKGGPPNFTGVWDEDGITFLRDGNHWPKQKPRKKTSS